MRAASPMIPNWPPPPNGPLIHYWIRLIRADAQGAKVSGLMRWGPEGPPEEAYSRVTDAGRFAPLHDAADETIARLEADYDVERDEGWGLDEELEKGMTCARPTVKLSPVDPDAASITVVFSDFPGLNLRFGRWRTELFPVCGCDACDDSVDDLVGELTMMVESVTAGAFREVVERSAALLTLDGWLETEFSGAFWQSSRDYIDDSPRLRRMLGGRRRLVLDWKPWPRREANSGPQPPPGFPRLTNEVQHLVRVLPWEIDTVTSPLKSGVRLPDYMPRPVRSGRSLQVWIARHRRSLGS